MGKPKTHNGVRQQNVIVRFKNHAARYRVYNARKKAKKVKICPNLTKYRQDILYNANETFSKANGVDFIFADIHGDLKVKLKVKVNDRDFYKFETLEELRNLLTRVELVEEDRE